MRAEGREPVRIMPTLDDERELLVLQTETGFSDSFFQCSLESWDGRSFFMSMGLSKNRTEKGTKWHTRLEINEKSISHKAPWRVPLFQTLKTGVIPEVDIVKQFGDNSFHIHYGKEEVTAELPNVTYVSRGDSWDFRYRPESGTGFDLHFQTLSRPFWFANGKEGAWTRSSKIKGFEAWTGVEGTLLWEGVPVKVKGLGVVERVKLTALLWGEVQWYDWIWVISDQLHLLLFHVNNGDYVDGKVFLTQGGDYLTIHQATIEFPEVSFIPDLNHFVSSKIRITAFTEKGLLVLDGKLRRMHKRDPFQDMEFDWQGEVSFRNGGSFSLTNIKGADEQGSLYSVHKA